MSIKTTAILLLTQIFCFVNGHSQESKKAQLDTLFNGLDIEKGSVVTYNTSMDEYFKYNSLMCDTGFLPASTFKIPNSLIALEEETVSDVNQIIKWDKVKSPNESCNSDQTLATALKNSCIWVYSKFAETIGLRKYKDYIDKINYGNKLLDEPSDRFWLEGGFKISANQQVEFLKRFYNYKLPFSQKNIDDVKKMILMQDRPNFKLSGKTGTGYINDKEVIVWFVGYIEKPNETLFFAINFIHDDISTASKKRGELLGTLFRII